MTKPQHLKPLDTYPIPVTLDPDIAAAMEKLIQDEMLALVNWGIASFAKFGPLCGAAEKGEAFELENMRIEDVLPSMHAVLEARAAMRKMHELIRETYLLPADKRWGEVQWALDPHGVVRVVEGDDFVPDTRHQH